MSFDRYKLWVKQFLPESLKDSFPRESATADIACQDSLAFTRQVYFYGEKHEYRNMSSLAEIIRAEGVLYFDYVEGFDLLLKTLLEQSITIFDNGSVFNDNEILQLPSTVYDIIFHQVNFAEYPPVCFDLYFELSKRVLDDRFISLYYLKNKGSWYYSQCLYFINMASGEFLQKPAKFIEIWNLMEKQIKKDGKLNWLKEYWYAAYLELTNGNKL